MPRSRHTPAELANDPTLRDLPYRKWEVLWSDVHQTELRFGHYTSDGRIVLAGLNSCGDLDPPVDPLSVRRPVHTVGHTPSTPIPDQVLREMDKARQQMKGAT